MALINNNGMSISFDSEELIEDLISDINEFGPDMELEVITVWSHGVKIYKDYNFIEEDPATAMPLEEGENLETMRAEDLLQAYIKQNTIM